MDTFCKSKLFFVIREMSTAAFAFFPVVFLCIWWPTTCQENKRFSCLTSLCPSTAPTDVHEHLTVTPQPLLLVSGAIPVTLSSYFSDLWTLCCDELFTHGQWISIKLPPDQQVLCKGVNAQTDQQTHKRHREKWQQRGRKQGVCSHSCNSDSFLTLGFSSGLGNIGFPSLS